MPNVPALTEAHPGEMGASELPGGRVAVLVHRGSYDGLRNAYGSIEAWAAGAGETLGQAPWESYVDDPAEVDDPALRTEIVWPLA